MALCRTLCAAAAVAQASALAVTLLAGGNGTSNPRPFSLNATSADGGLGYASVDAWDGVTRSLLLLARNNSDGSTAGPWLHVSTLVSDVTPGAVVTGGGCIQLPGKWNASIACAYEHSLPMTGGDTVYQLQLVTSRDAGATWSLPGAIAGAVSAQAGVHSPTLYVTARRGSDASPVLRCVYVAEAAAGSGGGALTSVLTQMESFDAGATWTPVRGDGASVAVPGAYLGSPAITQLSDGSLLLVFHGAPAGTPPGGAGGWAVWSARSFNGGDSWGQVAPLHAPADASCAAGLPSAAVCLLTNKIVVVFASNEPLEGGGCTARPAAHGAAYSGATGWAPAFLESVSGFLDADNASAPLNFTAAPRARVPVTGDGNATQPCVFVDFQSVGRSGPGGEGSVDDIPTRTMRVAYVSAGGGPAGTQPGAFLSDGTLCLS